MIHIAFNIDERYIPHCEFVMSCILHHTKEKVHFHIVGLDGYDNSDLMSFYKEPSKNGFKVESHHINDSALYRLFLPDILHLDKVIYLDCDILVRKDIKGLWKYNPKEIAGVIDPSVKTRFDDNYINSGVMVMNLKNLRENNYKNRLIAVREKCRTYLADQDAINLAFDIEHIPFKWNTPAKNFANQNESLTNKAKASIIHYTGPYKPWDYDCENFEFYREYEKLFGYRK